MDNLKQKTYKAFAWDMIGRFGNQGMSFVISIFLARLLEPSDFGMLAMVTVIIGISAIFQDLGLGSAVVQRKEIRDEHYGSVFYFNIAVGVLLGLILFFTAGLIANFYDNQQLKAITQVLAMSFLIGSFGNVRRLYLKKNLLFGIPVRASLFSMILGGTIGIVMAFGGFGVWSLVAQHLCSLTANNVYLYFATKWKPKLIFQWKALKELWGYGLNMFFSQLLNTTFQNLDNIFIGKLFTANMLGFYYRAMSLNNIVVNYTSSSLLNVLFPVLSKIQDNKEQYQNVIYKAFHLISFITFCSLGILYLTSEDIIVILFSAKWMPAVAFFKIMVLSGFVYPLSALLVNILSSKGNSAGFLKLEILKKILIGITFLVIFYYGIEAFLYSKLVVSVLALAINVNFAARELKLPQMWFYKMLMPYVFSGVVITGIFAYANNFISIKSFWLHAFANSIMFIFVYLVVAKTIKMAGYAILKEELSKMNFRGKLQKQLSKFKF